MVFLPGNGHVSSPLIVDLASVYSGIALDLSFVVAIVTFSSPQASSSPSGVCCYLAFREGLGVLGGFSQFSHSTLLA